MKKVILAFVLSLMIFSRLNAQTATAVVKVDVVDPLTVTTLSDVDFGQVFPNDQSVSIYPKNSANAGVFSVSGSPGTTIRIAFNAPAQLDNHTGSGKITFTAMTPTWNTKNVQSASRAFQASDGGTVELDSQNGTLYIWIGGTVNPNGAMAGHYEGSYTVDVTIE